MDAYVTLVMSNNLKITCPVGKIRFFNEEIGMKMNLDNDYINVNIGKVLIIRKPSQGELDHYAIHGY